MKRLLLVATAASIVWMLSACAEPDVRREQPSTPVPPPQTFSPATSPVARRLVSAPVRIVRSLRGIDPKVLALFRTKVARAEISDVGGRFNATDVVDDDAVPRRRLLFAGSAPGLWFILYEHGGIGYHQNLVVFTRQETGRWQISAAAQGGVAPGEENLAGLQKALRRGSFSEQPGYPYY